MGNCDVMTSHPTFEEQNWMPMAGNLHFDVKYGPALKEQMLTEIPGAVIIHLKPIQLNLT